MFEYNVTQKHLKSGGILMFVFSKDFPIFKSKGRINISAAKKISETSPFGLLMDNSPCVTICELFSNYQSSVGDRYSVKTFI